MRKLQKRIDFGGSPIRGFCARMAVKVATSGRCGKTAITAAGAAGEASLADPGCLSLSVHFAVHKLIVDAAGSQQTSVGWWRTAAAVIPGSRQGRVANAAGANNCATISSPRASNCLCLRPKNMRRFYSLRGKDTISQLCVRKVRACRNLGRGSPLPASAISLA